MNFHFLDINSKLVLTLPIKRYYLTKAKLSRGKQRQFYKCYNLTKCQCQVQFIN